MEKCTQALRLFGIYIERCTRELSLFGMTASNQWYIAAWIPQQETQLCLISKRNAILYLYLMEQEKQERERGVSNTER